MGEEFPYEIIDDPGETTVTLKRRLISGENIQIAIQDRDVDRKRNYLVIDVMIDKGEGHTLNFNGHLFAIGDFYHLHVALKRSIGTEAEAYYEDYFNRGVRLALEQYLVVRGIDSYLFDFYREYTMTRDKRVPAAGKFMMKRDKRACAAVKDMVSAADENLKRQLELEAQVVEQIESANEVHELPEDLPFQITESDHFAEMAAIILKRELAGESIQVTVFHDNRNLKMRTFRVIVMVNKEKGPTLRFSCKLNRDGLKIQSMKKSDKAKGKTHQWSDFSGLVLGLDMHKYLEIKGIKSSLFESSLFDFVDGYIEKQQSRRFWQDVKYCDFAVEDKSLKGHLMWLKCTREYLEK